MDAESELKRAKLAQAELNLTQEFLDSRRQELFEQFVGTMPTEDLHELHTEAVALTRLEMYLESLVNSGVLINANKENQYV
jgi:hypothetical protein